MKSRLIYFSFNFVLLFLALIVSLFALTGCATTKADKGAKYVFYPPAPDEPHIQFLASINSERDLVGSKGSFMNFLTGQRPVYLAFGKPYGGYAGGGKFYVCDTGQGAILGMDLVQKKMSIIAPEGAGSFQSPVNMAIDTNGWMFVADMGREQLIVLDDLGKFVATIGERGKTEPRDVAVTAERIYWADRMNHCIHVLDKTTRTNLFDIPRVGKETNFLGQLFQPLNIALDSRGRLYVSDFGSARVQIYNAEGMYLRTIGQQGDRYGDHFRNKGIAVDRENRVYVVENAGQMVQMFNEDGRLLMWFGEPNVNKSVGLNLPTKVLVDYDDVALFQKFAAPDFQVEHLVIVINQFGDRMVSVFGFGHKK